MVGSLSLLHIPLATTLLILLATASAQILDTKGILVYNGHSYRLFANGGYIGTKRENPKDCSRTFVALRMDRATPPTASLTQLTKQTFLNPSQDLTIDFGGMDPTCRQSGVWQLTLDPTTRGFVMTTGGTSFGPTSRFQIEGPVDLTVGILSFEYKIKYCPAPGILCDDVQVLDNGYLGIGSGKPLLVRFGPASPADYLSMII